MLGHRALLLGAVAAATIAAAPPPEPSQRSYVGPTTILFVDADTVYLLQSRAWLSDAVRHQDKLLRHRVRMEYWRRHLPGDMRDVLDVLGYPTGRVLRTPVGHTEEWWYYGPAETPLRFRDGILIDRDSFLSRSRR